MWNTAVLVSLLLPVSWQILSNDGEILSGADGISKTFLEVPIEFRVWCDNPEWGLNIPLELGIPEGRLETWVIPELLAVPGS